ncbi:putative disease resistance protein [Senna tora]|uniref:Putative disease resistance protein n=1 Tax=Senna tora TaxID=362788 RepID=A0A835CL17_9FABA|nr:putative disease resistance protein [Senna tora]
MAEIGTSAATKVVETCIDKAMKEAGYLFCFKSYVEDYEKEQSRLLATRQSLLEDIEEARQRNQTRIDKKIELWLKEADDLIDVDSTKAKKKWFGLCTNFIWQYNVGKKLAGKTLEIPKLIQIRNTLFQVARSTGPPSMEYHSLPNFMHFESRKSRFEQLKEALRNDNNHMIGLQGMGGTGKTTMATQVGKDVEESKLFDKVIFIVVSNSPDVNKIRNGIARHLVSKQEDAKELEDAENLWSRITKGEENLLIILDDVWQELNLKDVGIPLGFHQKGHCSVLLTTRDMRVCKKMGCQKMIYLELLSKEDALNLFLLHVGMSVDGSSSDTKTIASNIVKECGRLPVAIVAIAKTLKFEPLKEWKATLTRLQNFDPILLDIDEDLIEAYKSLSLSYENLKNEKAKELFLLCSLFPEDFELPIEDFSRIAIGLGLCGKADNYYIARSHVPEITHKLIDSSLLLKAEKECVKMHDLVREVGLWIGKEEIQGVMDSKTILKRNIRYSSWNIDDFPNHFEDNKLEFLLVRINAKNNLKLPFALLKDMMRLRVFILICTTESLETPTLSFPHSIHSITNIRTLILEKWKLGDISVLGKLQSLETLELTSCSITKLPNEIQALEKLRLLGLKYCEIEKNDPFKVIDGIPKLEELYYVRNIDNLDTENEGEEIHQSETLLALQRYHINGVRSNFLEVDASISRCFIPGKLIKIFSEATFEVLAARAEIIELGNYSNTGWTNLIPDVVPMKNGDVKDLIRLCLYFWPEIECIVNTKYLQSGVTIFSNLVELQLHYMDVKELYSGPLPTDFLKQLETLRLQWCMKLESTLLKGKLDLGKLKSILIDNCSMASLFHPSTARSLMQLETLEIALCNQLNYIITNEGLEEDDHDEIIFPSLKEIVISKVPNFINILESQSYHHKSTIMQNSSLSAIVRDGTHTYTFSWAPLFCCFRRKPSATTIDNPPYVDSEATLPNRTSSQGMHALKTEFVLDTVQCRLGPPLNPHKMRRMRITHCSYLTSLFTFSIASSMLLLETLEVKKCHGLKNIVTEEGDDHHHMNNNPIFPNLKEVSVNNCRLLESVLPASHCTTLDHLKSLKVSGIHKLRYVFGKCNCEDNLAHHNQNVEVLLPSLEQLIIQRVPNMVNICSENNYMTALSLREIALAECPQLPLRPLFDFTRRKAMEMRQENLLSLYLNNVEIETIYDFERLQIRGPMKSMLEVVRLKNLPKLSLPQLSEIFVLDCEELVQIIEETDQNPNLLCQECFPNLATIYVKRCKRLTCLFSISSCGMLPNLENLKIEDASELEQVFEYKQGETREMVIKDVFPKLETLVLKNLPSLDSVCQGFDFQTVPERFVQDCPKISLTSTITVSDDDDEDDDKDRFERTFLITSSEDEESPEDQDNHVQSKSSQDSAFQSTKATAFNFFTTSLSFSTTKDDDDDDEDFEESYQEMVGSNESPAPNTSNSQLHEGEKPPLQFCTNQTQSDLTESKKEATKQFVEMDLGIQEQNNSTSNSTKTTKEAANGVEKQVLSSMKPETVSDPEFVVTQSNQAYFSGTSEFPQDEIILNHDIENPKQFEEDELMRLFQIMEESADMEVHNHMLHVSKLASVENDNNVAKAFADLEVSLKMGVNEIATSEENSIRLRNALNLLSTHFSKDGAPSHGLSATIDSLHQEFQSILSSFKQASSTVGAFTELEEKEKFMINEELPRRKQEARTLVSEISKTEKSMGEAQQKEAEMKEQISRLKANLNSKEKEIKNCEFKLLSLKEQKNKSVSETIKFMKEFEDVKKDKSEMMEEERKARQELEKVDVKWSSCVTNLRKTTVMAGIHLNHKF